MERFRGGAVQLEIKSSEPRENLRRALELIEGSPPADLYLLPELFTTGYRLSRASKLAEEGEETLQALRRFAGERGSALSGSLLHPFEGGVANTGFFIDRDGTLFPFYRKIHLFKPMDEDRYLTPGREPLVWETTFGRVAMAICYDLRFPGMIRKLAHKGAGLLLVPAEWPGARLNHWRVLSCARAIENGFFVLAANRTGSSGGESFPGASRIVDPWGEILCEGDGAEGVFSGEIDMERLAGARARFNALADVVQGVD
jgi:predicted amidohydrolase